MIDAMIRYYDRRALKIAGLSIAAAVVMGMGSCDPKPLPGDDTFCVSFYPVYFDAAQRTQLRAILSEEQLRKLAGNNVAYEKRCPLKK